MKRAVAAALIAGLGCNGLVVHPPGQREGSDPAGGAAGPGPKTQPGSPTIPGAPGSPRGPAGSAPGPGQPPAPPGAAGAMTAQVPCSAGVGAGLTETVGRRVLRRLTGPELEATVRTAFGLDQSQWAGPSLPTDASSLDGFTNNVDRLTVGPDFAQGALDSAREVAKVVGSQPLLGKLLPCSTQPGDGLTLLPCGQQFVDTYGTRLYRRTLTAAEKARYTDLFMKTGRGDFKLFVHWATFTMLQSPNVLYRSELGKPDGAGHYKLTPDEVASALAFTFTGGPPTPDLIQAAATGRLSSPDQIEAAARGLVYDAAGKVKPAFQQVMLGFTDEWLGLGTLSDLKKDGAAFPDFTPEVQGALAAEVHSFLGGVLFDQKGSAATLLTAPYTFVNATLARYYGVPAGGDGFTRVDRPAGTGVGLLALGGLMAVESHNLSTSPTKRGYFIRTRLLCGTVPPPPPVVSDLPPPSDATTTRQRYESLHVKDPACKGCHALFDPIGFAFEHLDAGGRYRAKEGSFDIDDSGVVTGTSGGDLKFRGPTELAGALARLPEVPDCLASYLAAYAFGLAQSSTSCLVRAAADELRAGGSLVDFYIRLARSEHFRTRLP